MASINVNKIERRGRLSLLDSVKFQVTQYCYFNQIMISPRQLDCVALLAVSGEQDLTSFCEVLSEKKIFDNPQSARTSIGKIEAKSLIVKTGKNKKKIKVADLKLQLVPPILIDIKLLTIETTTN